MIRHQKQSLDSDRDGGEIADRMHHSEVQETKLFIIVNQNVHPLFLNSSFI